MLTIFQCQFSVDFFLLFIVEVFKVMRVQALWKRLFICLFLWEILRASVMMFTDLRVSCRESVAISSVLHFHQSVPFLASLRLHLSLYLFHVSDVSRYQLCVSHTFHKPLAQTEPILYRQRLSWHNSFIWQQSNATSRPSVPSSGTSNDSIHSAFWLFIFKRLLLSHKFATRCISTCSYSMTLNLEKAYDKPVSTQGLLTNLVLELLMTSADWVGSVFMEMLIFRLFSSAKIVNRFVDRSTAVWLN